MSIFILLDNPNRFKNLSEFVRLYPIPFRYLEGAMQFKKYQWIRANITKATSDPRPESYNIAPDSIELGDIIKAGRTWEERCAWLLNENTVFPSVSIGEYG